MSTINFPTSPTVGQTYSMSGKIWGFDGTKWNYTNSSEPWVRPSNWLTLPDVTGLQKFAGLFAVYPEGNFVALNAEGNYTVNWGDGTGDNNVSSGVTAEYNVPYANAAQTSDVGISAAIACSFTDSGDTVNLTAHGWLNGQQVAFNTVTSTSGLSTYTTYYIVNKTADTFQIATDIGSVAIALTTNGSGSIYIPLHRQVIITVVPNGGNLTKLAFNIAHSLTGISHTVEFLDMIISAPYLTDLQLSAQWPGAYSQTRKFNALKQFSLLASDCRQLGNLFYSCPGLRSVPIFNTSTAAVVTTSCTFTDTGDTIDIVGHGFRNWDPVIFTTINSTTGISKNTAYFVRDKTDDTFKVATAYGSAAIALTTNGTGTAVRGTTYQALFAGCKSLDSVSLNTENVINFTALFSNCENLKTFTLNDTSKVLIFNAMFQNCYSIESIPLFNTSAGIILSNIFYNCYSLTHIPQFDTSNCIDLASAFYWCVSLKSIPLLDTSKVTTFSSTFNTCYSLLNIPLLDTSSVTNFSNGFYHCDSLKTIPLINTSNVTNFNNAFQYCTSIEEIPKLNTSSGVSFASTFYGCTHLKTIPLLDTSLATNISSMFYFCDRIEYIPPLNTSSVSAGNFNNSVTYLSNCYSAAFQGTAQNIDYSYGKFSATELNRIYNGLATVTAKTITVTGCWGNTSDDPTIATAKGWTVTG